MTQEGKGKTMELLAHVNLEADHGFVSVDLVTIAGEGVRLDVQACCDGYAPGHVHTSIVTPIECQVKDLLTSITRLDHNQIIDMLANIERVTLGSLHHTSETMKAFYSLALSKICQSFAGVSSDSPLHCCL